MELILFFTLIVTTLVFCPLKLFDGYILPQIGTGALGIGTATVFFLINGEIPINFSIILILIYFGYLMMTNIWTTVLHNSTKDIPLVFMGCFAFIVYSSLDNINMVFIGVSFCSIIASFYAILQSFGIDPIFKEKAVTRIDEFKDKNENEIPEFCRNKNFVDVRAISTLGNTNFAAGYFIASMPFIFILPLLISPWLFFIAVPFLWAIVATKSRAGLLSVIVFGVSFLLFISQRGLIFDFLFFIAEINSVETTIFLSVATLFIGWMLLKHSDDINFLKGLSEDNKINNLLDINNTHKDHFVSHLRYRFRYWKAAWHLIKERPLFGYGLRTYRKEIYRAQAELNMKSNGVFLNDDYQTPQPRECHNDIIENFVEGGIVGGGLFLIICIFVFAHGFIFLLGSNEIKDIMIMSLLLSGLIASLSNASFFFPLRLAPSSLCFWVNLAMIEVFSGNVIIENFAINPLIIIIVAIMIIAMIFECSIKPNLANYYYTKHCFSGNIEKREKYLMKAIKYAPKDTIYRQVAALNYLQAFPDHSEEHSRVMYNHFDGMSPAWAITYNCALIRAFNNDNAGAVRFLSESLFYLPSFEPSKILMNRVFPLAPLPRRRITMKKISNESHQLIRQFQEKASMANARSQQKNITNDDIQKCMDIRNQSESTVLNLILSEKVKMNIPANWPFDIENGVFLAPNEITGDHKVIEAGITKIPLTQIMKKN